jgi:hypothetical protein
MKDSRHGFVKTFILRMSIHSKIGLYLYQTETKALYQLFRRCSLGCCIYIAASILQTIYSPCLAINTVYCSGDMQEQRIGRSLKKLFKYCTNKIKKLEII